MKILSIIGLLFLFGVTVVYSGSADPVAKNVQLVDKYTIKGVKNFYNGYEPGDKEGNVNVVIEIPKGTTGKWEVSATDGTIVWEFKKGKPREVTFQGGYPANYGSIPQTAMPKEFGGDGESIDVVVIGDAIPRGSVVKVKLIGILNLMEDKEYDAKLLAVRIGSPEYQAANTAELNSKHNGIVDKVSYWFTNYKGPDAGLRVESIGSADEAMQLLMTAATAYQEKMK